MSRLGMLLSLFLMIWPALAVRIIDNGLAPPEIVHTPVSVKPRCVIRAPPLDLVFMLDSSGSLRDQFQDEIDIIRRIIKHVTIGQKATRVMLVQFSGTQHLEFDFHKFGSREELLAALDVLRHVSGITRIGEAFEFTLNKMNNASLGMRDASVPKILYILSDGRTHDFPKDWEMADVVRRTVPNMSIWAYGTGEYVAWPALVNYTTDAHKIVTNKNLEALEPLFNPYKGIEICDKIPSCVKGSDRPLDMVLVIDASESLDQLFQKQIDFAVDRVLGNIHVHPEAVRMALITYSGTPFIHFKFNDRRFGNNSAVADYLRSLRSIKGTTSTHLALREAMHLLLSADPNAGTRSGIPKMVLVLTDGHSARSPQPIANEMRANGITLMAVSIAERPRVDEAELLMIAGDNSRVFAPWNLQEFEAEFMKHVGFGCEGIELGPDAKPRVRGATDVTCSANSVTFTVRTQKEMSGLMYAQHFHDDPNCLVQAAGNSREHSITFNVGTCGLLKTPTEERDGYRFNITVILQFHPLIMTRADQGLDVTCFYAQPITRQEIDRSVIRSVADTSCRYTLHRFNPGQCVALDAKVGETLYHRWSCDSPPQYHYLVHDCQVRSERSSAMIIDSDGCEVDEHFLETPNYTRLGNTDGYVYQEMSVFKFPADDNLNFRCRISLCDMDDKDGGCATQIPPKCSKKRSHAVRVKRQAENEQSLPSFFRLDRQTQNHRSRRNIVPTKPGFYMTIEVETRTLNVLLSEGIRPKDSLKYCDF